MRSGSAGFGLRREGKYRAQLSSVCVESSINGKQFDDGVNTREPDVQRLFIAYTRKTEGEICTWKVPSGFQVQS